VIQHVILRALSKLLIPLIMLFALYVQFHGDYGPGGGFQAGVIFGAGIILYALMFGLKRAKRVFPPRVLEFLVAFGLLLYGSVGVAAILMGGNFLDYDVLAHDPHHGQHLGILLVELGVGITVAAVMATIFFQFAGRGRASD
jgi:multicomponent Na+:H+ antiporter subunit B